MAGADPSLDLSRSSTLAAANASILYPRRVAATTLALAGLLGLMLAVTGLYGVVSYSIGQRAREFGIRATLGADRRDIMALVIRDGATVAATGLAAGLALGIAAMRLASTYVAAMPAADVTTLLAIPAALAAVILLACLIPARRAARVDPMMVLRSL